MVKRCFLLVLSLLVMSCAEKVIEPPEDLISKEKMTNILYDLALLNSAKSTNKAVLKKYSVEVMPYLYEKYEIDSVQFVESDLYYASIPLEYEAIYTEIEKRLEKEVDKINEERKQKTEAAREKSKKVRDSIKNNASKTVNDSVPEEK